MALVVLFFLLALYIRLISHIVLFEIKFQTLEAEYLPPKEANLDNKILVKLLLTSLPVATKSSISMSCTCIFNFAL